MIANCPSPVPFYLAEKSLFCLKERHCGFLICVCEKTDPREKYERAVENTGQNRGGLEPKKYWKFREK